MWPRDSVVAQGVDELVLAHLRAAVDADLGSALLEIVLGPVLVGTGLAAALAGRCAVRIGDPRGLLLAGALVAERLVLLWILDAGSWALLWHTTGLPSDPAAYPARCMQQR